MKIDSTYLSKENNKILMNQIYLILMPIAKYLLNSKIGITENDEYPISISLPFNVKKENKRLSFLFPNINIKVIVNSQPQTSQKKSAGIY